MGRIRTKFIKKNTRKIMEAYPDNFSDDFEKNKNSLKENKNVDIYGKKLRNKIAGYATKLKRDKKRIEKTVEQKPDEQKSAPK